MADKQTESPSPGASRAPWRVEGAPEPSEPQPSRRRPPFAPPGGRWFWLVLLALLAVNWYVG